MKKIIYCVISIWIVCFLNGCAALNVAKDAVILTGKAVVTTAKVTGKVAYSTGKAIKTVIEIPMGISRVRLTKRGNSYIVKTVLDRKIRTNMILDTGCTDVQITQKVAERLGIDQSEGRRVTCTLADGRKVTARAVNIKEVKVGRARVKNLEGVVLDDDRMKEYDGLLGMSFLNNFKFRIDTEKNELTLERRRD